MGSYITERTPVEGIQEIYQTFERLGFGKLDFGENFMEAYKGFHWVLMPHPEAKERFYAIPDEARLKELPWDSWYFLNGKPYHHIHYAESPGEDWAPWIQLVQAAECPEELVGITWYWKNTCDVTPALLTK